MPPSQTHKQPPESAPISATNTPTIFYGHYLIAGAFIAQFVSFGMQNYITGPFMIPMTESLDWSRAEFTVSRSIGQFIMALTGFVIGTWVDRFGARRFMFIGSVVMALSMLATSQIYALWQWIVLNGFILTTGAAMTGNLVVNVTLSKWFVDLRGRAVAWAAMGVSFAGIALTPLCYRLIEQFGWREAWQWLALLTILLTWPVAAIMRRAPEDQGLHPDGRTKAQLEAGAGVSAAADMARSMTREQAIRTPVFYVLVLAFGLFVLNVSVMLIQTIPMLQDAGFSAATGASMIALASVPALISKPIWGYVIDKTDARPLAAGGALLTAFSLAAVNISLDSGMITAIAAAYVLIGIAWGGMIPLQEVIWANFFGRRYLGAVRSAALPLTLLISAIGPLGTSMYFDLTGNYTGALWMVIAALVISAALLQVVRPPSLNTPTH